MASTFTVSRSHLVYGLCLPLAVVLGIVLAEPLKSTSLAVVVMVFAVLGAPVLIRWYHPFLLFSWNAAFYFGFLPGDLPLWTFMASLAFVVAVLNRCTGVGVQLMAERRIAWPLIALAMVVMVTALLTGGFGMRIFGSQVFGGSKYVFIGLAILGYFALASRRIAPQKAMWCVALFFLPGMTGVLGNLIEMAVPRFGSLYYLYYVIPPGDALYQASEQSVVGTELARIGGWAPTSHFACLFLLARFGAKGILDLSRPWRLGFWLFFLGAGLFGGFRSFPIVIGLIFAVAFFAEGLHRTRYALMVLLMMTMCAALLIPFASRLPSPAQRALSFLPLDINPTVRGNAQGSTEWRVEMWKRVLPDVPRYLLKGKGYGLDPNEVTMAAENTARGIGYKAEAWAVSGEYHNGPLSVLIPFGLWGALAFGWFLAAGIRMMYRNCVYGEASLASINRTLFACFVAKAVYFVVVFGAIHSDLPTFAGLAGLAVSLNGAPGEKAAGWDWEAAARPAHV